MWNHRVFKNICPITKEVYYDIKEAFYLGRSKRKPTCWTRDSIAPIAETPKDLEITLKRMLEALKAPIVTDKTELTPEELANGNLKNLNASWNHLKLLLQDQIDLTNGELSKAKANKLHKITKLMNELLDVIGDK